MVEYKIKTYEECAPDCVIGHLVLQDGGSVRYRVNGSGLIVASGLGRAIWDVRKNRGFPDAYLERESKNV